MKMLSSGIFCLLLLTATNGCATGVRVPPFDETRAFDLLAKQVSLGPRVPGSPGHKAGANLIISQLKPYADSVSTL